MQMRRLSFVAVVVLLALGLSACNKSPTSPSPATPQYPPLTSDFQLEGPVSAATLPVGSPTVTVGSGWEVTFSFRCRAGTLYGVVFQKGDQTMSGNGAGICSRQDEDLPSGRIFRNTIDDRLYRFSGGKDVTIRLATAPDTETWVAGKYTIQDRLLEFTLHFQ